MSFVDQAPVELNDFAAWLFELAPPTIAAPPRIALGVSGGSDSRALLELSAALSKQHPLDLHVVTVDHGLRAESAAEAASVGRRAQELGLPHAILRWRAPKPASNRAAAAREARYRLMATWRREQGIPLLAVAHTEDDVAETFLLRLARGSGVDGLAEMAAQVREADDLWRIRPLLRASRAALRATCRAYGAEWVEDPSNDDPSYDRTKARAALKALAPLGLTKTRLAKTAAAMRRARLALETQATALSAASARCDDVIGWIALAPGPLIAAPAEIALRVLAGALKRVAGATYPPRLDALEEAFEVVIKGEGAGRALHGCLMSRLSSGEVAICREPAACAAPTPLAPGRAAEWDKRVRVETGRAGLTARALGDDGVAALRAMEAEGALTPPATWRAAPRAAQRSYGAVFANNDVVAAPAAGLGPPDVSIESLFAKC